jgi:hypothetical protein
MKWKEKFTEVFLINLPERIDRLAVSDAILKEAGIDYTLWIATKNENGIKGLCLTMKALFEYAMLIGLENFIVLEDDCNFKLPINEFLNLLTEQLPENYDCLYLGCNLTSKPERYSENILKINTSYCTQAICYSRKAVEVIMKDIDKIEPYDIKLMKIIQGRGMSYCTFPMFCEQFESYSNIENRIMDWASYQRQTYASYTKNI